MVEDASMGLDDELDVDANTDYGRSIGYFVRLDVEIRSDAIYPKATTPGVAVAGYVALSADRAESLGATLMERARDVRRANEQHRKEPAE